MQLMENMYRTKTHNFLIKLINSYINYNYKNVRFKISFLFYTNNQWIHWLLKKSELVFASQEITEKRMSEHF